MSERPILVSTALASEAAPPAQASGSLAPLTRDTAMGSPPAKSPVSALAGFTSVNHATWERTLAPAGSALPPPRLLVVLAHPDDEVLAMGARLERLSVSRLVTVTDGAPTNGADALEHGFRSLVTYREARQAELASALAHASLPESVAAPFPAMPVVPDQQASLHLEELTRGLMAVIEEFAPEAVLTHPYEGGHPDHDACAFAVHTALRLLLSRSATAQIKTPQPLLLEAPFYHNDGNSGLKTSAFLNAEDFPPQQLPLSAEEQANKRVRLACFQTQASTLGQFGTESESFRVAPTYDFSRPPHEGQLLYECFSWGMTGSRFRALVAEAESRLRGEAIALPCFSIQGIQP